MKQIGKRIYYDLVTGNVILVTGERRGAVLPTTVVQDVETYKALSERNRDTFDYIELEYGQYAQDFAESNGYRINPETEELEFSYPDPNEPEVEQPYQQPLSEQVATLETQNTELMLAIAEMAESDAVEKTEMQLAIAEIAEIVEGGA